MVSSSTGSSQWFDTLRGLGHLRPPAAEELRIELEVLPLDGRTPKFEAWVDDVDRRGIFVATPHALPLGTLLVLRLKTRFGQLRLSARVVHCLVRLGFGCEFIDLDARQLGALEFLVGFYRAWDRDRAGATLH